MGPQNWYPRAEKLVDRFRVSIFLPLMEGSSLGKNPLLWIPRSPLEWTKIGEPLAGSWGTRLPSQLPSGRQLPIGMDQLVAARTRFEQKDVALGRSCARVCLSFCGGRHKWVGCPFGCPEKIRKASNLGGPESIYNIASAACDVKCCLWFSARSGAHQGHCVCRCFARVSVLVGVFTCKCACARVYVASSNVLLACVLA